MFYCEDCGADAKGECVCKEIESITSCSEEMGDIMSDLKSLKERLLLLRDSKKNAIFAIAKKRFKQQFEAKEEKS